MAENSRAGACIPAIERGLRAGREMADGLNWRPQPATSSAEPRGALLFDYEHEDEYEYDSLLSERFWKAG